MQWKNWGIKGGVAVALVATMVGCAPIQPVTQATGEVDTEATAEPVAESPLADGTTYDDPFAYCAAVGTVDAPDERYTGEELPDVIAEGIRAAWDAEDVDLEVFQRGTIWRCMDSKVYACNVGANIPCEAKADESTEPTQPMIDYCEQDPNVNYIPAVVTGRTTIFEWGCDETEPVILQQYTEVDPQGFLQFAWHELTPPE